MILNKIDILKDEEVQVFQNDYQFDNKVTTSLVIIEKAGAAMSLSPRQAREVAKALITFFNKG